MLKVGMKMGVNLIDQDDTFNVGSGSVQYIAVPDDSPEYR